MEDSKQLDKLVSFIRKEAEEKADEILKMGKEESNLEKSNLIQTQRMKISKEYEQKEHQVQLQRKIMHANVVNQSKLKKLKSQQEQIGKSFEKAHARLSEITKSSNYPELLGKLILQALVHIDESNVTLSCRKEDISIVESILPNVLNEYHSKWLIDKTKKCTVVIDKENHLACSGGVLLSAKEGKIICNNTLDMRLAYAYETSLPLVRRILFSGIKEH